jgi:transcriptional regulator with XRE-family HTH domain
VGSDIGSEIRKQLKLRGMSQKELADACGITEAAVSRYLNHGRMPKTIILKKMAEVLSVDVNIFFNEKKDIESLGTYQGVFKTELQRLVSQKCKEINHYISGCDSPFSYTQIREVQASLNDIEEVLGIKKTKS